ncbi:MAG: topoisomerase C-terminal repeat-containing protein, partial [Dehalococcoidia bacterium]|nr:topoisomerase C-terminal repeat-containing protein [Dehalococcoidia bacterium]
QDGPSGPYLKSGTDTRSIEGGHAQMATLTLDEAVAILAQPRTFRRGAAGAVAKSVLKELGAHPDSAKPVTVRSGRFGPYVTDGVVNASLPRGRDPLSLEMQDALDLLAAREEKMRAEGKDPHAAKPKTTRPRTTRSPRAKPSPRTRRSA